MSYNQPKYTNTYPQYNHPPPNQQQPPQQPIGNAPMNQPPMQQMNQPPMIKYPYVMRIPTYQEVQPMIYCPQPYDNRNRHDNGRGRDRDYRNDDRYERRGYY